ncbi:MAG: hypothetical protein U0996_26165 [Planctomycetaceae bacterium]
MPVNRVTLPISLLTAALSMALTGCEEAANEIDPAKLARAAAKDDSTTLKVSPEELKKKLNCYQAKFLVEGNDIVEASLFQSGIRDISALKGLPLRGLDLGMTRVSDLSVVAGMPLETLDLENTQVSDLSVLKGMKLSMLKLQNTKVTDFSVLQGMPLEQLNLLNVPFANEHLALITDAPLEILWLAGTQVTDLAGLPTRRLKSLDVENTKVRAIDLLSTATSLERLNIARTEITDLTPLKGLRLQRIVLSPERIVTGIDVLRQMKSLALIQTSIEEEQSAADFWKRYDVGAYKSP